ncbi:MAG: PQQ-binding-like beta-propeller repeat protein [Bacteroidia bacterium]|nr:PQQ-binding-like beta-propeller repeat protein [Bacteroidia bacterium]
MNKIFLPLILSMICISANAQKIAQWRGPSRNGIYNETGLLKKWPDAGPKLIWHFDELGEGHTSVATTGSVILTTGMINETGYVFAFNNYGKLLWKKDYGKEWTENWNGVRSTPLIVNDKLFLMSSFGKLVCMNISNGKNIWTIDLQKQYDGRNIKWGVTENLLFDGNTLFCSPGGVDANVIALKLSTGKLIWKSKGNGEKSAYCSPLLITLPNRKIIVTMMENSIQGIDASTGKFLWKHPQPNEWSVHPNVPVFADGNLYCTSGYGQGGVMLKLSADGSSVAELWRNKSLDPRMGGVVVFNDRIYGTGDRNRSLFCIDWQTGNELYSIKDMAPANIIANDGLLYIYSESGKVSLIEPQTNGFNILSSFPVPFGANPHWAHLVIKDKKLYVRHGTSLMVYDIAAK